MNSVDESASRQTGWPVQVVPNRTRGLRVFESVQSGPPSPGRPLGRCTAGAAN